MAADRSENLHQLLESFPDDLQNLNLTLHRKLFKQLEELVGPQEITIREEIAAFEREKAEVEEACTRISEWVENVKKQFEEQLMEEVATSQVQPEHMVMKFFTTQPELHAAAQRNRDELKKILKKLERRKKWVEYTVKQLQELKGMIELVQNALLYR